MSFDVQVLLIPATFPPLITNDIPSRSDALQVEVLIAISKSLLLRPLVSIPLQKCLTDIVEEINVSKATFEVMSMETTTTTIATTVKNIRSGNNK